MTTRAPRFRRAEALVEDLPTHVVKEDIDAVRGLLAESILEVRALVVDRGVETELVDEHVALLGTAGDTDHRRALDLRDLAHGRTDTAGSARDQHRLALAEPSDVEQPEIGGQPSEAQNAEIGGRSETLGDLDLVVVLAVGYGVFLHAEGTVDPVTGLKPRMTDAITWPTASARITAPISTGGR